MNEIPADVVVPAETVLEQTRAILRAWGAPPEHVEVIAGCMHESDLRGIDSHGVGMFPNYARLLAEEAIHIRPNIRVVHDDAATALIDADHALGHVPATMAMDLACDKAARFGIAMVAVRNSNHYGAAGVYTSKATARGLIGINTTGTSQRSVVPTFAREPRFSTNPIAFSAPAAHNPEFCLDMATSTVAVGKVNIARRAGKPLPEGWALTAQGTPERDAAAAFHSKPKRLTPLGGNRELGSHKGYGLAMMVEILCSVLTDSFIGGHDPRTWEKGRYINAGHCMIAIDPNRFALGERFETRMDRLIDMLHDSPRADEAQPVLVAGDPEHAERARRLAEGIPMVPTLIAEVSEVARRAGAPVLLPQPGEAAAAAS